MDRKQFSEKLKNLRKDKRVVGLGATGAIALTLGFFVAPRFTQHFKTQPLTPRSIIGTYGKAFESVQEKVEALHLSEVENERLRLENTHLRLKLEGVQFDCSSRDAANKTHAIEYKLDKETGSVTGRELSSIAYRVPTHLLPQQAYTLGISYFKAREDEKAAVIFTFLTGLDENVEFKTAKNFLMTGVSWYRLDNFAMADRYFDKALREPESKEALASQAEARLWKALVSQRLGKHANSQFWLTELVDHNPRSAEASWVNTGGKRGVASSAANTSSKED